MLEDQAYELEVSIHASVKDATLFLKWYLFAATRFNPRICKRCDSCWSLKTAASRCFNPRICKRCDLRFKLQLAPDVVSIHASVKDATAHGQQPFLGEKFQSTHL